LETFPNDLASYQLPGVLSAEKLGVIGGWMRSFYSKAAISAQKLETSASPTMSQVESAALLRIYRRGLPSFTRKL
jgi:hypothetical protein